MYLILLFAGLTVANKFPPLWSDEVNGDYKDLKAWMLLNKISHLNVKLWHDATAIEPWLIYRESYPLDKPVEVVHMFAQDPGSVERFKERQAAIESVYPSNTAAYSIRHFYSNNLYVWVFAGKGDTLRAAAERLTNSVHARIFLYAEGLAVLQRFHEQGWVFEGLELDDFLLPAPAVGGPLLVAFSKMRRGDEQQSVQEMIGLMARLEVESRQAKSDTSFNSEELQRRLAKLISDSPAAWLSETLPKLRAQLNGLCEESAHELAKDASANSVEIAKPSPVERMRGARDRAVFNTAAPQKFSDVSKPETMVVLCTVALGLLGLYIILAMGAIFMALRKSPAHLIRGDIPPSGFQPSN